MNDTERRIIDKFKQLLERELRLDQVILFGSRARGDAAPDSDLDILVIIDDATEGSEEYISECAWEAGFDQGIVIVPVVYNKREWENGPDRLSLLARAIEMEGVHV